MSDAIITRRGGGGSEQPLNGITLKAKVIESNVEANTWGELVIDDAEATTEYINPADNTEFVVSNIIPGTTDEVYLVKRTDRTVDEYNQTSIAIARAKVLEKSYSLISPWQTLEKKYFSTRVALGDTSGSSANPTIGRIFSPMHRGQIFALASNRIVIIAYDFILTGVYDSSTQTFTFSNRWQQCYSSNSYYGDLTRPDISTVFLSNDNTELICIIIERQVSYSYNYINLITFSIGVSSNGAAMVTYNDLGFKSGLVAPEGNTTYNEKWFPINREQRIYGSSYNVIKFNSTYTTYEVLKANKTGSLLVDISNSKIFNVNYYNYPNNKNNGKINSPAPLSKYFDSNLPWDIQGHNGKVIHHKSISLYMGSSYGNIPNPDPPFILECYMIVDYSNLDNPIVIQELLLPEKYAFTKSDNGKRVIKPFNSNELYLAIYASRWDFPEPNYIFMLKNVNNYSYEAKIVGVVKIFKYNMDTGKIELLPLIRGMTAISASSSIEFSAANFGFSAALIPYLNKPLLYVSAMGYKSGSNQVYPDKGSKLIDFEKNLNYKFAPLGYNDVNKYYPREKVLALESGVVGDDIKITFGGY